MKQTLLITLLVLSSCTSARQKQAAADAIAGVDALEQFAPPQAATIAAGTRSYVAAVAQTKQKDLPTPTRTADEIIGDPEAYQKAGAKAEEDATSGTFWAWLGGAGLGLLGVLRFIPGAHQPIVSVVQTLLESKIDKAAREKEESLAKGARTMIAVIEKYGTPEIKAYIQKKVPSVAKDAIDAYLNEELKE